VPAWYEPVRGWCELTRQCTYSGFNPLNKAHIHFGEGSAEANHDLAITEYWECRDLAQSNKT
jgi:hypothetical protein